jgi:hypothetical protein
MKLLMVQNRIIRKRRQLIFCSLILRRQLILNLSLDLAVFGFAKQEQLNLGNRPIINETNPKMRIRSYCELHRKPSNIREYLG